MHTNAEMEVLEIEILAVRGLRLSPQTYIAEAAIKRERVIQAEIDELRRKSRTEQNVVADAGEDYPEAVGFSMGPRDEAGAETGNSK